MSLEAGIWALRLGFGPQGWDLSLKARISALKGVDGEGGGGEEGEISPMCESIGHQPLRGRCPKSGQTDRPTNGPTNRPTDKAGCRVA